MEGKLIFSDEDVKLLERVRKFMLCSVDEGAKIGYADHSRMCNIFYNVEGISAGRIQITGDKERDRRHNDRRKESE